MKSLTIALDRWAAQEMALRTIDDGCSGPPFDPLDLADRCGIQLVARGDIPDARLVPATSGSSVLQYNPIRPRGRLRFSIAHEIAHTLFPDHGEQVRNRANHPSEDSRPDNWQLEVLCNIGAAERLMPLGSIANPTSNDVSIQKVMGTSEQNRALLRDLALAIHEGNGINANGRY